jgi:hypothetical protein
VKRNLVIVAVLVGCAIAIRNVAKEREAARHPHFATTEQFISFASDHAVMDARQYDHVTLDYSLGSLKQVDKILGRVHDSYVAKPASVSLSGVSAEYGAYVGEVIRRNEPNAYWSRDSQVMGEKSYPLHWNAGEPYPFAWCSRRITNGEEDSIWMKYAVLKDRASTARVAASSGH